MKAYSKPERHSFLKEQAAKMKAAAAAPGHAAVYESFTAGDRIRHNVFGDGTVTEVKEMGNDAMITINFDTRGVKRIMRNNAKVAKI